MKKYKTFQLLSKYTYGPVESRRYGKSLGVNVLPPSVKVCSFNCPYCQLGWTYKKDIKEVKYPDSSEILKELEQRLTSEPQIDSITFSGNGEPTMHPDFLRIVRKTIELRNRYKPAAITTVLTDGVHIESEGILEALELIDNPMVKLDAGTEKMFKVVNIPMVEITLRTVVDNILKLKKRKIQTMFVKGRIDNTVDEEVNAWLELLKEIQPQEVHIYSIDRYPADTRLEVVSREVLDKIASKVKFIGIRVDAY
ncbi:MAG: radical SAM protein [Planctomycetes bacterium]|nr:radical SAM protein [Planctomycetota bacterium]